MTPFFIIAVIAAVFLLLERVRPGRELPHARGWFFRSIALNLVQLALTVVAGFTWNRWFQSFSLFHVGATLPAPLAGFLFWLVGTFVFYWWHRVRHREGWWRVFHQVHHSPQRIEVLTSFYKHPLEMLINTLIISTIVYAFFGGSVAAAGWYNVFAVFAELFYHANICTPHWIGYLIQRPEHHSIHHQTGVHRYNFADLTIWDRLFGTFKDTTRFADSCGFSQEEEQKLAHMLVWKRM